MFRSLIPGARQNAYGDRGTSGWVERTRRIIPKKEVISNQPLTGTLAKTTALVGRDTHRPTHTPVRRWVLKPAMANPIVIKPNTRL